MSKSVDSNVLTCTCSQPRNGKAYELPHVNGVKRMDSQLSVIFKSFPRRKAMKLGVQHTAGSDHVPITC